MFPEILGLKRNKAFHRETPLGEALSSISKLGFLGTSLLINHYKKFEYARMALLLFNFRETKPNGFKNHGHRNALAKT